MGDKNGLTGAERMIEELMHCYASAENVREETLRTLYASDLVFKDPTNYLSGVDDFISHTLSLYSHVIYCEFDFDEENLITAPEKASIPWVMKLAHKKLNRGREFSVRGVSIVRYNDKIFFQEDFYDLGAAVYEQVPVLGSIVKKLRLGMQA